MAIRVEERLFCDACGAEFPVVHSEFRFMPGLRSQAGKKGWLTQSPSPGKNGGDLCPNCARKILAEEPT